MEVLRPLLIGLTIDMFNFMQHRRRLQPGWLEAANGILSFKAAGCRRRRRCMKSNAPNDTLRTHKV